MDQQSGDTADKRNWRERLGIGKNANTSELPKLSDEFKGEGGVDTAQRVAAPRPAAAHAPVKAAPMAPRAPRAGSAPGGAPRAATPAPARGASPAAPRAAPVAPDALASKLRDQREAAERLAQQRIQAAKARAEAAQQSSQPQAAPAGKPKFTFAEDGNSPNGASAPRPASAWPPQQTPAPRPAAGQPQAQPPRPQFTPQVQPPRPPLGGAATPPPAYPSPQPSYGQPGQGYGQQPYQPQYNNPGFSNPYGQQQPGYRPIDPNTGYTPPPGFNPQSPRPSLPASGPVGSRLSPTPQRGSVYTTQQPQLQIGPALDDADSDDIFETAPQRSSGRRATANDYASAYQDELEYEDQPQRSGSFGMILGLLLLGLLVAFAVVFGYSHFIKGQTASSGNGSVPVVNAPATPTKSTPDANTSQQGDAANKKLIYDRIEGDHEVPGGTLKSTEQPPAATQGGDTGGGATNGDASQPVPLPPPPGTNTNNGQQGALSPDANTNVASATPAAGQTPAANSSDAGNSTQNNMTTASVAPDTSAAKATPIPAGAQPAAQDANIPAPPVPSASATAAAADGGNEEIGSIKTKPAAKPALKLATGETAKPGLEIANGKSLGSSPVVLVPPAKTAETTPVSAGTPIVAAKPSTTVPAVPAAAGNGGGLYGDNASAATLTQQTAIATPKAPALAAPAPSAVVASTPKAGTGAYVVQLSSFSSQAEASQEYQRLGSKHGALITRYAPIITQSSIAGSARYNLNLGPMASNDVASNVCSSLIAAGERDCSVRRQ